MTVTSAPEPPGTEAGGRGGVKTATVEAAVVRPPTKARQVGVGGGLAALAPGAVVVVPTAVLLVASGVPAWDLLRYAAYLAWAVVLPGTLVYRALHGKRHSLLDDLVFGAAVGLALEILAFVVFSALDLRGLLWCWPMLVVLPFVGFPRLRRHWRPAPTAPVPRAWAWAVAAITVLLSAYIAGAYVSLEPITPTTPHLYFVDLNYLLALASEAKHHFPLHSPQVAGEPLAYHWFSAAHMASASLISGVQLPAIFYGLAVPAFGVTLVPMLALVGWRVTGRPWVGVVAATLTFVVGELAFGTYFYLGDITRFVVWSSPSQTYSGLSTLPLIMLICQAVQRRAAWRPSAGALVLLALFALQAGGSKASGIPVLLAGIGLAGLVDLLRRRRIAPTLVVLGGVLVLAYLVDAAVLFRFESHGLVLDPRATLRPLLGNGAHRSGPWNVAVWLLAIGAFALFMLLRLIGIGFAARLHRPWRHTEWFLLGTIVSGVAAALLLGHPAWSQMFFLRSAWPAGVILSALGVVVFLERLEVPARWTAIGVGLAAVTAAVVGMAIQLLDPWPGGSRPHQVVAPIYGTAAAFVGVLVAGALGWWVTGRRLTVPRHAGAVWALALLLLAGLPILPHDVYISQRLGPARFDPGIANRVGPAELALASWVQRNVGVDEVIVTNEHCLGPTGPGCLTLQFWFSAYTERRVLVGGWGYVPRAVGDATTLHLQFGRTPFWDQELLHDNDVVFSAPTADNTRKVYTRYGVRWLFVNRTVGTESPGLANFADLRYADASYAIYELRKG